MSDTAIAFKTPVDAPVTAIVPVCFIGDVSGSMISGPGPVSPIDAVNSGIESLLETLKLHPEAADTALVQIISFADSASVVLPYSHVREAVIPPRLSAGGGTSYGQAFSLARREMEVMVRTAKAAGTVVYRPTVYLLTDGEPNDSGWEAELDALSTSPFAPNVCVFGVAGANATTLREVARRDRGQVWLADSGTDPAVAFANLFPALVRTVMQSASAVAAGQPAPAPIPASVPGMTQLDAI